MKQWTKAEIEAEFGNLTADVSILPASQFRPASVEWVWPGWLARGKLHVIAGAPGTGKTTVSLALGATVTMAGRWPDGFRADAGDVFIWSGEDDPTDTLIPRLIACGAFLSRVYVICGIASEEGGTRPFDPATDTDRLSDQIALSGRSPSLLIIDPIVSAVTGDSHKNAETRRALQPLVDLAQARRCAVLGVTHFSKGTIGRDPVERVTGSLAFGALARVVLATAKLPDEEGGGRILARSKNNLGVDTGGFRYDLEVCELPEHPGIEATRVLWGEALDGTARALLAMAETSEDPEEKGAVADAKQFLRTLLESDPVPSKVVKRECEEAGHAWASVRRAQKALGVEVIKEGGRFGDGKQLWRWKLPSPPPEGAQKKREHLEHLLREPSIYGTSRPL